MAEPAGAPRHGRLVRVAPGVLLAVLVAAVALVVDTLLRRWGYGSPGGPVLALLLGTGLAAVRPPGRRASPGLRVAGSRLLQVGIVLLGLTVPVSALAEVGPRALPVVVVAVVTAFATTTVLGRLLGVDRDLRLLLGAGTGVCGASAIAATAAVLRARPSDVGYALSVVVVMNLAAIATLPVVARVVGLTDTGFGAWVGASVNDTSAVVALAGTWSGAALTVAVVVKLTRVLALVPVTLVLAHVAAPDTREAGPARTPSTLVPPFLVLFVLAVVVAATGVVPTQAAALLDVAVGLLLTVALAAVGLSTRLRDVARAGWSPVVLGALTWLAVACATLGGVLAVGLA